MPALNPFHVLGLPKTVDLDRARVQQAYLARSSALHPDLHADDPEAESAAAELNRAREILLDDEQRLVTLWKLIVAESDLTPEARHSVLEDKTLPSAFLMEMMDVREQIEHARSARDQAALERWEQWGGEQRTQYIHDVGVMLASAMTSPAHASQKNLADIKARLNAWRYIERLLEQLGGHDSL